MHNKRPVIIVSAVILSVILYYGWLFIAEVLHAGKISASGTIEAIEVQVGSKVSGRVEKLYVDEGLTVKKGDIIYIPPNELHSYVNTGNEDLELICVIPLML